jgi:hypothetical protein
MTSSRSNLTARRTKALNYPGLAARLAGGGKYFLHGWGKVGPRGCRKTWQCAEQELTRAAVEDYQRRADGAGPTAVPGAPVPADARG